MIMVVAGKEQPQSLHILPLLVSAEYEDFAWQIMIDVRIVNLVTLMLSVIQIALRIFDVRQVYGDKNGERTSGVIK